MRKTSLKPYIAVVLLLFLPFICPRAWVEECRYMLVASFSLPWQKMHKAKEGSVRIDRDSYDKAKEQADLLARENELLKQELTLLKEWLGFNQYIDRQIELLRMLAGRQDQDPQLKSFFQRRAEDLAQKVDMTIQSLPAKVVFREPTTWNNYCWISVGEKQNKKLKRKIVGVNSPVIVGNNVVGIIDYVGKKYSRVRLITDSSLLCSVRALRGREQNVHLYEKIEALMIALETSSSKEKKNPLTEETLTQLKKLIQGLQLGEKDAYLAKGEVRGDGYPLWRSQKPCLKGIGFNYDFSDEEGPARHLITGLPMGSTDMKEAVSILKEGDILVTSGLDGMFPKGLRVGSVSKVHSPREGACSYEIEVIPSAENLNELKSVFVLYPLELTPKAFD